MSWAAVFLVGFLVGGLVVRRLTVRAHRRIAPHGVHEESYVAAIRTASRHFRTHDTLNAHELAQLMEVAPDTALTYARYLATNGFLREHRHTSGGAFFTRP